MHMLLCMSELIPCTPPLPPLAVCFYFISTSWLMQVCVAGENPAGTLCLNAPSCVKICENCSTSDCPSDFGDLCSSTEDECVLPIGSPACPA